MNVGEVKGRRKPTIHVTVSPKAAELIDFLVVNRFASSRSDAVETAVEVLAVSLLSIIRIYEKVLEKLRSGINPPETLVYDAYAEFLKEYAREKVELSTLLKPDVFTRTIGEMVGSGEATGKLKMLVDELLRQERRTSSGRRLEKPIATMER
jgi:hypothetical protein